MLWKHTAAAHVVFWEFREPCEVRQRGREATATAVSALCFTLRLPSGGTLARGAVVATAKETLTSPDKSGKEEGLSHFTCHPQTVDVLYILPKEAAPRRVSAASNCLIHFVLMRINRLCSVRQTCLKSLDGPYTRSQVARHTGSRKSSMSGNEASKIRCHGSGGIFVSGFFLSKTKNQVNVETSRLTTTQKERQPFPGVSRASLLNLRTGARARRSKKTLLVETEERKEERAQGSIGQCAPYPLNPIGLRRHSERP